MKRVATFALILLAGCGAAREGCVTLAEGSPPWCLLEPARAPAFEVLSEVEITRKERSEVVLVQVENDSSGLRAAVLSPLGQRLAWAQWQGGRLERQSLGGQERVDAGALLALVQIARWPEPELARAAAEQGFDFFAAGNQRSLRDARRRVLVESSAEGAGLRMRLPQLDLALRIRDLPAAGDAP